MLIFRKIEEGEILANFLHHLGECKKTLTKKRTEMQLVLGKKFASQLSHFCSEHFFTQKKLNCVGESSFVSRVPP